jgi:putative effector of murein hydrolase
MKLLEKIKTPLPKRPAFWAFLSSLIGFLSVYFLQEKVDPILLLDVLKALLALIGVSVLAKVSYDRFQESKNG